MHFVKTLYVPAAILLVTRLFAIFMSDELCTYMQPPINAIFSLQTVSVFIFNCLVDTMYKPPPFSEAVFLVMVVDIIFELVVFRKYNPVIDNIVC